MSTPGIIKKHKELEQNWLKADLNYFIYSSRN